MRLSLADDNFGYHNEEVISTELEKACDKGIFSQKDDDNSLWVGAKNRGKWVRAHPEY
jgi:hypothetical protein